MATMTVATAQQNTFTNHVLQGDCIEVMHVMPANSVDFILTDPPYLVNYRDRTGRTIQNDVDESWLKPAMAEAYRKQASLHFQLITSVLTTIHPKHKPTAPR